MMGNAKPKLTLTGPVLIDSHMIMPEDLTRMAEIRDSWHKLSPGAQRYMDDIFASRSNSDCAAEAVEFICKARPEMVFYQADRSPSTECTEEAREHPMRPKG